MRMLWWRLRHRLSQWICPHTCREPIEVQCVFEGGPAHGKTFTERWLSCKTCVPIIGKVEARAYSDLDLLDFEIVPFECHPYELSHVVYRDAGFNEAAKS